MLSDLDTYLSIAGGVMLALALVAWIAFATVLPTNDPVTHFKQWDLESRKATAKKIARAANIIMCSAFGLWFGAIWATLIP